MNYRARLYVRALEDRIAPALFTVMNTLDSGPGSLRQAVLDANALPGADTINFAVQGTITLTTGELLVTDMLTINGPGASFLIISGNKSSRIIETQSGQHTITDLSFRDGVANAGGAIDAGNASLIINHCVFSGNSATVGGGAIAYGTGLTLNDCTLTGNSAQTFGGAASTYWPLTANRCTFSNNLSTKGGGLYLVNSGTFDSCTISGNTATASGGGIFNGGYFGGITATNCTIDHNIASGNGGGIYVQNNAPQFTNCTIANNWAAGDGGGILSTNLNLANCTVAYNHASGKGGGLRVYATPQFPTAITSTVVAKNDAPAGPDIFSDQKISCANCDIYVMSGTSVYTPLFPAILPPGQDPMLGQLADNGGPTRTIGLLPGSPLIDAGANPNNLTTDERGAGFPRGNGSAADIGAFESPLLAPAGVATSPAVRWGGGTSQAITVTYYSNQAIDVSTLGTGNIIVTGPGGFTATPTFIGVYPAGNGSPRVATYQFTPPGGTWDLSDNGTYAIQQAANQVFDANTPTPNAAPAVLLGTLSVTVPTAVFVVDHAIDENDGNISPGNLSLREAIGLANANAGAMAGITFDPTVFATPQTMLLTLGEIQITHPVTIIGPAARLTLDANQSSRIFTIDVPGTRSNPFAISHLTLTKGKSTGADGGAIRIADEDVTLDDVTITNCSTDGNGGAIALGTLGTLSISDSVLDGNSATGAKSTGGGFDVQADGHLTVSRCSISGNTALNGGGVFLHPFSRVDMTACTLSSNTATSFGGGIANVGKSSGTLSNCTLSANIAGSEGGGIAGTIAVLNSTVAFNTASTDGGGLADSATVTSSIVAKNTAPSGHDVYSSSVCNNSLIGNTSGSGITGANNLLNVDPMLGPLANNGGPTLTHALMSGSPAINAGSNPAVLVNDQRGVGFYRSSGGKTDIGAYEMQFPPEVQSIIVNNGAVQRSRVTTIEVVFDSLVSFSGPPTNAIQLQRQSDSQFVALTATVNNYGTTAVVLTFNGALSQAGSLLDGRYTLTVLAAPVSDANGQLDGNGDGIGGDNYSLVGTPSNGLFRFFGDINGDGTIDASDFIQFRQYFGGYLFAFDFDGDGSVSASDFMQFRLRFGGSI
jgi:parallel beta-helix repeat protein